MSPAPLSIQLFGPMRVLVCGEPLPRVRTRSVHWLLALMVLRHGRAIERSWLAGTLWPESTESQALKNLRDDLSRLRAALGPGAARVQSPTRDTLSLDLTRADVDVATFDRGIQAGDDGALSAAVEVYTGPLLEGCYEEWAQSERDVRQAQCVEALLMLADHARSRGEYAEAVRHLQRAEILDPLRDSTARLLMESLDATGDAAAAVDVYRRLRNRLHDELSASPDPETTRLFREIRERARKGAGAQALRRSGGQETESTPTAHHRPPHRLTSLIGREREVGAILAKFETSRLVTLVGAGGVGKTRLAIELATLLEDSSEARSIWVELAPLADENLILPTIAAALGIRQEGAADTGVLLNRAVAQLSEGSPLLALDNCEHLLDGVARVAQELLTRCPRLRVLATSRQRLGLAGEVTWRVPSLQAPDPKELPADPTAAVAVALSSPAIRLFDERASWADASFRMTRREDVEAVCQICRRLDGIPLAIELAAARVRSLTVRDICDRLDQRFRILTGGSRSAMPRHQTLQSLIDWSYDMLSDGEKALLNRLSVFVGGWTLEAAERVCAVDPLEAGDVLEYLTSLADKSLVTAETKGIRARYRLLETVRQYARDRLLEREEDELIRGRHLEYFTELAEMAEPNLLSGPNQKEWIERLEAEHDNLRAALAFSSGLGTLSERSTLNLELGLRLCAALWRFWFMRGHLYEGRTLASRVLEAAPPTPSKARAGTLSGAGNLAWCQGDFEAAWSLHQQSLSIRRELGEPREIASSLVNLGLVAMERREYASAKTLFEEGLTLFRAIGAKTGEANALGNLGSVAYRQQEYGVARDRYQECMTIQREIGDRWGVAMSLGNLGSVSYEMGDFTVARDFHRESLAIRRELGDQWGIALTLAGVAAVDAALCHPEAAARLWGAAERLRAEIGAPMPPEEQTLHEARIAGTRAALGDDAAFDEAWAVGRAMTLEQAIELALQD